MIKFQNFLTKIFANFLLWLQCNLAKTAKFPSSSEAHFARRGLENLLISSQWPPEACLCANFCQHVVWWIPCWGAGQDLWDARPNLTPKWLCKFALSSSPTGTLSLLLTRSTTPWYTVSHVSSICS